MKLESEPVVVGAVGKVKIQPLLRDFQAEGESPALGLFHGAAFSTALLPTNSAKGPKFLRLCPQFRKSWYMWNRKKNFLSSRKLEIIVKQRMYWSSQGAHFFRTRLVLEKSSKFRHALVEA